jgi:hypothetical protein
MHHGNLVEKYKQFWKCLQSIWHRWLTHKISNWMRRSWRIQLQLLYVSQAFIFTNHKKRARTWFLLHLQLILWLLHYLMQTSYLDFNVNILPVFQLKDSHDKVGGAQVKYASQLSTSLLTDNLAWKIRWTRVNVHWTFSCCFHSSSPTMGRWDNRTLLRISAHPRLLQWHGPHTTALLHRITNNNSNHMVIWPPIQQSTRYSE